MNDFLLKRTIYNNSYNIPSYYLSVTYRDLNARKARWAKEKNTQRVRPAIKKWDIFSENNPNSGLIARISKEGQVDKTSPSDFLHGILVTDLGVLSASHHSISLNSFDLSSSKVFSEFSTYNALHSMRKSKNGYLVTSSGTDVIYEISPNGNEILWEWWAIDHGFDTDSFGIKRELDKSTDHRYLEYDTWLHSAHVNSAAEYNENTIIATLFMNGTVIQIDKKTGKWDTLISDLKRPHSIRVYPDKKISFSDTANGIAMFGIIEQGEFKLENKVSIPSIWLQDSQFENGIWLLVDGEHSSVHFVDSNNNLLVSDQFDSDWYLYEATPTIVSSL